MKLEIKHLAPYFPYGLQFISEMDVPFDEHYENPVWTLNGVSEMFGDYCLLTKENSDAYVIDSCKPILRPLSDLTKTINWGIHSYEFTSLFEIGDTDGFIYEFSHGNIKLLKDLSSIARHNSHNDINYLPYPVVKMMFEYHFDIFGLIEAGLAIDINLLDN